MVALKPEYIENMKERIQKNSDILPENKKLILDFHRYLDLQEYSINRQYKYLVMLPKWAQQLHIPFNKAKKEDIETLVLWLKKRKDIGDTTKLHYKIILKRFYKWLGNDEYPECVKFIKTTEKKYNKKLPKDMFTERDIRRLLKAATHPRNRAFIAMLWETGARIDELLTLKVGDIEDYKHGMKVVVNGKTGERRLILILSVPYINDWLKTHPTRKKGDPLWVNIGTKNNGMAIEYRAITKMLILTGKKAGTSKPMNPHHFRHSRATYMANHFKEAQMCEWFGWVQGSKEPARYVHLSGRDIDNAYAKIHGIEDDEQKKLESELKFITCPRCGYDNGSVSQFCSRCGMALDPKVALEMTVATDELDGMLSSLLEDDDVKALMIDKLKNKAFDSITTTN